MSNLAEISVFIDRYKDFSKRLERQKIIHYISKFDGLFSGFDSLKNVISILDEKEAFSYNIFNILNIHTAEVKTHTPFLRNLLEPNGTHGQKDLFLITFIQNFIPIDKRELFILSNINDYNVEEEKPTQCGRIDIFIESINSKKKFGIIIENKLLAGDQHLQLNRYYDFVKARKFIDQQIMMFYLTIDGHDPSEYSIDKKTMSELKNRKILYNLSYKTDIKNWLKNIIKDIKSNKVKFLIEQYLEMIEHF